MAFEDRNKGLPTNFELVNGKFGLIGGKPKIDDNVRMVVCFFGWFRYFTPDFVVNFYKFYQQTTSYVNQYKNVFRLRTLQAVAKYIPFGEFYTVDVLSNFNERKKLSIVFQYRYRLDSSDVFQTVKVITNLT